jgi:hypothetical protein
MIDDGREEARTSDAVDLDEFAGFRRDRGLRLESDVDAAGRVGDEEDWSAGGVEIFIVEGDDGAEADRIGTAGLPGVEAVGGAGGGDSGQSGLGRQLAAERENQKAEDGAKDEDTQKSVSRCFPACLG